MVGIGREKRKSTPGVIARGGHGKANLFAFFVGLVALAVLAKLAQLQTYLQLGVAGRVVVGFAALGTFEADHGFLWHTRWNGAGYRI